MERTFTFTANYNNYGWNEADNVLTLSKNGIFGVIVPQPRNTILKYGFTTVKNYKYIGSGNYRIELVDSVPIETESTKLLSNRYVLISMSNDDKFIIDLYSGKCFLITIQTDDYVDNVVENITLNEIDIEKYFLYKKIKFKNKLEENRTIEYDIDNDFKIKISSPEDMKEGVAKNMINFYLRNKYLYENSYSLKWNRFINIDDYFSNKRAKFEIYKINDKLYYVSIFGIFNALHLKIDEDISKLINEYPELIFIKLKEYFKEFLDIKIIKNVCYVFGHKLTYGCLIKDDKVYDYHLSHLPYINKLYEREFTERLNSKIRDKIEKNRLNIKTDELMKKKSEEILDIIREINTLTIQDSIDAGNCEIGTTGFLKILNIEDNTFITGEKLSKLLEDKSINIKNRDFLKVIAKKLLDSQED